MHTCCRCENAAGFWVMARDARVVRRPWCLSCIIAFLDADEVTVTRIACPSGTNGQLSGYAFRQSGLW